MFRSKWPLFILLILIPYFWTLIIVQSLDHSCQCTWQPINRSQFYLGLGLKRFTQPFKLSESIKWIPMLFEDETLKIPSSTDHFARNLLHNTSRSMGKKTDLVTVGQILYVLQIHRFILYGKVTPCTACHELFVFRNRKHKKLTFLQTIFYFDCTEFQNFCCPILQRLQL